jgi:putative hemolysin
MELLILVGLIVLNGVFAMSELAVVSSKKARLKAAADRGNRGAAAALMLQDDPSRFLSTVQIGITMVGIVAGAYGATALADDLEPLITGAAPQLAEHAGQIAFGVVIALTTYLSLVVGELAPKRLALVAPEAIASVVAAPMGLLAKFAYPVVWLLRASTDGLLKLLGLSGMTIAPVTEEEIHAILDEGATSGAIENQERIMMRGVMRLADRSVRDIMTPRPEMVWIDADDPIEEALREMAQSGHSRFPLARGDLEHVIGVIQAKDLLARQAAGRTLDLASEARTATFVPETLSVMKLLESMQSGAARMAIVVDEHGVVQGIATAADLLGAIAGSGAFSPEDALTPPRRRDDGSWLVDGFTSVDDLELLLGTSGLRAPDGAYSTVAGLVMHHLQRLPETGDVALVGVWRFEVVDMDGRRIDAVIVSPGKT